LITPAGAKHWRFKFRFAGKEKKLSFGSYPHVSLAAAREKRDDARRIIAVGTDPVAKRQQQEGDEKARDEEKFDFVANEWLSRPELQGRAQTTIRKMRSIVDFARPAIGPKIMSEITAQDLLAVLRPIYTSTATSARRISAPSKDFINLGT
jgi:hypothetical protein